jgi:nitrite reductase (NADH) large subunit
VLYGLWGASLAQGAIAGMNAAGGTATFGGLPRTSALKVLGIDLVSIGDFQPLDGSWVVIADEGAEHFRHLVFRDGAMVGAILIGESQAASTVRKAVESRRNFAHLLRLNPSAEDVIQALAE